MSDRFKFRVWDNTTNHYWFNGSINIDSNGNIFVIPVDSNEKLYYLSNATIEQCTGLKDKNGNLIYEGDIIKDRFGRKFKVVWSQEDVMFDGRIIIYDPEYRDRYDLYEGATDDIEIIGNIHEQKE